jgi:hypothetical protein
VPKEALLADPNLDSVEVFVIEEGKARIRIVRVEETEASTVRILSGIKAGDVVATSEVRQLYDGANVKVQ